MRAVAPDVDCEAQGFAEADICLHPRFHSVVDARKNPFAVVLLIVELVVGFEEAEEGPERSVVDDDERDVCARNEVDDKHVKFAENR